MLPQIKKLPRDPVEHADNIFKRIINRAGPQLEEWLTRNSKPHKKLVKYPWLLDPEYAKAKALIFFLDDIFQWFKEQENDNKFQYNHALKEFVKVLEGWNSNIIKLKNEWLNNEWIKTLKINNIAHNHMIITYDYYEPELVNKLFFIEDLESENITKADIENIDCLIAESIYRRNTELLIHSSDYAISSNYIKDYLKEYRDAKESNQ
jgi:hypothetical protein